MRREIRKLMWLWIAVFVLSITLITIKVVEVVDNKNKINNYYVEVHRTSFNGQGINVLSRDINDMKFYDFSKEKNIIKYDDVFHVFYLVSKVPFLVNNEKVNMYEVNNVSYIKVKDIKEVRLKGSVVVWKATQMIFLKV